MIHMNVNAGFLEDNSNTNKIRSKMFKFFKGSRYNAKLVVN
jgi:hypothetical protein